MGSNRSRKRDTHSKWGNNMGLFSRGKLAYKYKLSKVEQSKIIFDLISGKLDLKEKFNIKIEDQGKNIGLTKIKLVPFNPEPNMVLVYLWIDEKKFNQKDRHNRFFLEMKT